MNKKRISVIAVSSLLLAMSSSAFAKPAAGCGCAADGSMRDMTTQQLVNDMGLGVNLGNTFESVCHWTDDGSCGTTVNDYETAWGSPTVTRAMIAGYKTAGIKTVRVPVAWSNMMTGDALANGQTGGTYDINPLLMARVKEVTDWILDEDMYAIINIHWDGGWWEKFPTDSTEAMRKFRRIWEQVGDAFKDYGDRVVFASLNEEGGWNDIWNNDEWNSSQPNHRDNMEAKARSYGILNAINQAFVDVIRSQSGNNAHRHLQIQGYKTNIDRTVDNLFIVPTDPRAGGSRIAVSVHYYDPFAFTHISEPVDWGGIINPRTTWGTEADYAELNNYMDKLIPRFVNQGIPVIIGEYGVASWDTKFERERESVRKYTLAVTQAIRERGMLPILWEVQLNADDGEIVYYYDRHTASFVDADFAAGMLEIAEEFKTSVRDNRISGVKNSQLARPNVSVRGRTLSVSSPNNSALSIRMIDARGKVRARFNADGNGNFSLTKIPAGRYFVDVRGAGVKQTLPVVVK